MTIPRDKSSPLDGLIIFLATGGLIGFAPVAPGTFGTAVALPLCLWITSLTLATQILMVTLLTAGSVWIAHRASQLVGKHDPKQVVIDEICGMSVALIGVPFEPGCVIWGFILFRGFDILKPFPIRWIDQNVGGGWGIVMDDVVAGLLANAVMHLVLLP